MDDLHVSHSLDLPEHAELGIEPTDSIQSSLKDESNWIQSRNVHQIAEVLYVTDVIRE